MSESVSSNIKGALDSDEYKNVENILICANLGRPGERTPDLNVANKCTAIVKNASRKGWVGHLPLTILALQQEPFQKDGKGSDSAANKTLTVVEKIFDLDQQPANDKAPSSYICTANERTCIKSPVTGDELGYALVGYGKGKNPQMNPSRAVPVDKPIAAILAYADAQMNMDRYLDEGKTLQATVARIFQENNTNYDGIEKAFKLCVTNNPIPDTKSECAKFGARFGLADALVSGVRYRGTEFLGVPSGPKAGVSPSVGKR